MSITPYINASIILQLLTVAIPALERMVKDGGEEGRKKIASWSPVTLGVLLGLLQGLSYYALLRNGFSGKTMLSEHRRSCSRNHYRDFHCGHRADHVDG